MATTKAPSILEALKEIKKGKLLPLYYLFGADTYNLSFTLKSIQEGYLHQMKQLQDLIK